jgi:hypothetical protein
MWSKEFTLQGSYSLKKEAIFNELIEELIQVVHTVPLPSFLKVEPSFATDEKGKLIEHSFTLDLQVIEHTRYTYGLAVFNFEGFSIIIYGKNSFVRDVIHELYEYDVFEVGFDELLLFTNPTSLRMYVNQNYLHFGLSSERTVHNGL